MPSQLSPAEKELLSIYTRQAYDSYLSENLKDCEEKLNKIESLNKGDANVVFLRGAITGRRARPGKGMEYIQDALKIWRPLFEQLTGEGGEAMRSAISEALTTILYIPVDLASRQWDVYCDAPTARELSATVKSILDYDDMYHSMIGDNYAQWIHSQFVANYVFLVDEIVGLNKPIPVGGQTDAIAAYGDALSSVTQMADRIPSLGESEVAVKRNAAQKMERFHKHNDLHL